MTEDFAHRTSQSPTRFQNSAEITLRTFKLGLGSVLTALLMVPSLTLAEASPSVLNAPETGSFPDETLSGWKVRSFNDFTEYTLVPAGDAQVLRGSSDDTASVLYKEQTVPLKDTPWLNWSWRVENTLGDLDEQTRGGDDFPARVYVVISTGFMPWDSIAINYVWASNTDIDTAWLSPFTDKSMMVALQSGDDHLGVWKNERRNIVADYKEFFDMDIEEIDGYAVMVDSDNSDQKATAYFGNISFSEE